MGFQTRKFDSIYTVFSVYWSVVLGCTNLITLKRIAKVLIYYIKMQTWSPQAWINSTNDQEKLYPKNQHGSVKPIVCTGSSVQFAVTPKNEGGTVVVLKTHFTSVIWAGKISYFCESMQPQEIKVNVSLISLLRKRYQTWKTRLPCIIYRWLWRLQRCSVRQLHPTASLWLGCAFRSTRLESMNFISSSLYWIEPHCVLM